MNNKKGIKTLIQLVLFTALGGGVIWYQFAQMTAVQKTEMFSAIRHTNLWYIFPVFAVTIIAHWARARRWQILLDPLGIHPTTINTLFAVLIGYMVNLIPPRAGEVAKCTVLARYEKVPADMMVGTIVAERTWDVLCLIAVVAAGLFWQGPVLDENLKGTLLKYAPHGASLTVILLIIGAIAGAMIVFVKMRPASKVGRFFRGIGAGVSSIFRMKKVSLFMVYTVLIWGGYIGQILLGFWSLEGSANLGLGPAMMVLIFGSVGMIAAPGGLGLYPYLVSLVLIGGYGVSKPDADAFGIVSWSFLTGLVLILGFLSLILLPFYNRTEHDAKAPVDHR